MTQVQKQEMKSTRVYSSVGSGKSRHVEYKWSDKFNCMIPFMGDEFNLYEQIQLSKTSCDLDMIIKRAKAGDTSVLNVRAGSYADVSTIPDNLNDLNALHNRINDSFNNFPKEIKDLFGGKLDNFSNAVADGSYEKTINDYYTAINQNKQDKEVKENV